MVDHSTTVRISEFNISLCHSASFELSLRACKAKMFVPYVGVALATILPSSLSHPIMSSLLHMHKHVQFSHIAS